MPDTAILLCPYNHSQQLERMADGTSTYPRDPIQEEGNYYKKEVKRDKRGRARRPPTHQRHRKRLPRPCWGPILSDKTSSSQLDRKEHRDDHCPENSTHEECRDYRRPYTKAKLFGPLSRNSLYRAHRSKVPSILGRAWKTWPYISYLILICIGHAKYQINQVNTPI